MSASSVHRIKERGGGGAKISAAPAGRISPLTGKENARSKSTSRVRDTTQKPSLRPIPRVDKSAAQDPPSRRSTSSVPRGRSSSPSEFSRALSDLRKNSARVSGPPQRKTYTIGFKSERDEGLVKDVVKNGDNVSEVDGGFQEKERVKIRVVSNGNSGVKEGRLSSNLLERKDPGNRSSEKIGGNLRAITTRRSDFDSSSEKSASEFDRRSDVGSDESKVKSSAAGMQSRLSSRDSRPVPKVSSFSEGPRSDNKHPSKLHEKLAFLEGKVKRIASDIKRTKEMLDMNNQDTSKMILSDIQEKISGIEKAMSHVNVGGATVGVVKNGENLHKKEGIEVMNARSSVKGLNNEELEARLFPHHKLIRNRTLLKTQSSGSETCKLKAVESTGAINSDEGNEISVDNDAIALEFLASLSMEESHVDCPKAGVVQEMGDAKILLSESALTALNSKTNLHAFLMADEKLNEFDEQDGLPGMEFEEGDEENFTYKLNDIGCKASSGGWFVSEGESVLLAHDDGCCSFYDIANCEEKAEYKPPAGVLPNKRNDCWIIRAPSADGCSGRFVVAASAGNSVGPGFCTWDFYSKEVRAFHFENETSKRAAITYERNTLPSIIATENRQWWYKPCGPLIAATASSQRMVQLYDIRDGEQIMRWELQKPVLAMDYASPLHWRNRGKVVIAESDGISLWDVSSLSSEALLSISSVGRKISALHINNTDAELGGGIRQRVSSQEAEGNDGVFCTQDSINVVDFRHPSGIGLKIPKVGFIAHSIFSRGDSIYVGCSNLISAGKKQYSSQIQQFSLRKQTPFSTYTLPDSNAHKYNHSTAITQVWGNSNLVMGVCGVGLFVFDSLEDNTMPIPTDKFNSNTRFVKEVIGPDDMCSSFDFSGSRILLISKDRCARWRYL